jgi:hypothetical protein
MKSAGWMSMTTLPFQIGQQVAIFRMSRDEDSAVQELAGVIFADSYLVRLSNGQVYYQRNGHSVSPTLSRRYIVPATKTHRHSMEQRWN